MSKVVVIGGAGRLGLRLSLVAAVNGHQVVGVDIDDERLNEIRQSNLPFVEHGAEIYLEEALKKKTLNLTSEYEPVKDADVIVITVGTPVDSNLNPGLEPVAGVLFDIAEYLKNNQLIVFRNTLSPAILGRIKTIIEDKTNLKVGKEIFLAFAPEINSENNNINELKNANQPIGAFDEKSYKKAEEFFRTITSGKTNQLSPEEAMLAKLMDNMFSYIKTACANEFYLIADSFNANIYKILEATNNIPNPNPNSAGPGMHKEGWFLVDRIPFPELVTTAFKINESLPAQIVQKLEKQNINKVTILGMTNRANSDDARSSLSYKLRKALYYKDYAVACYDPYLPEFSDSSVLQNSDAIILMTPHKEFKDLRHILNLVNNTQCIIIDLNGFWEETKKYAQEYKNNGVFSLKPGVVKT